MFGQNKLSDRGLEIFEVSDGQGTVARFVPDRGGILTEFDTLGTPMFYLDRDTLFDKEKNIRGGNPVLFPICGPLEAGAYTLADGRRFEMKQHGLARNSPWEVTGVECGKDKASVTMELSSDVMSRGGYPFDFRLVFTYTVEQGRVTIHQRYCNESQSDMPFYAGFHPYFYAPGVEVPSLYIPSDECCDLKKSQIRPFEGRLDLKEEPETNLVFMNLRDNEAWFARKDGFRVTLRFDDSFRYIVLWSLKDREFLCVEPWMGNNYDMNRGKARILKAGMELSALVSYCLEQI